MRKSIKKATIKRYEKIYGPLKFGDTIKIKSHFGKFENINNKIGIFLKYDVQDLNFLFCNVFVECKFYFDLIRAEIDLIK